MIETNACMVIAHPDDDAVFGAFFEKQFDFNWSIITCSGTPERVKELQNWQSSYIHQNIVVKNLNFDDNPNDFESKISSWDEDLLEKSLKDELKNYDLVLSHNTNGEYGHPHHKAVGEVISKVCNDLNIPLYVFGYGLKDADIILRGDSIADKVRETYKSQSWVVDSFDPCIQTYMRVL